GAEKMRLFLCLDSHSAVRQPRTCDCPHRPGNLRPGVARRSPQIPAARGKSSWRAKPDGGAMRQTGSDAAINAPLTGSHIQIIACAGSGKTETLACRVAHLLTQDVQPESIVAFTFTKKAAAELKQRILDRSKEKCGPSVLGRVGRMYVGSIHAYAL